jgi:hypothetical protein
MGASVATGGRQTIVTQSDIKIPRNYTIGVLLYSPAKGIVFVRSYRSRFYNLYKPVLCIIGISSNFS